MQEKKYNTKTKQNLSLQQTKVKNRRYRRDTVESWWDLLLERV